MEEALNVKTMWTIWEWLVISWLPLSLFMGIAVADGKFGQKRTWKSFYVPHHPDDCFADKGYRCAHWRSLPFVSTEHSVWHSTLYLPDPVLFYWKLRNLHDNLDRVWDTEHDYPRDLREVRDSAYCERDARFHRLCQVLLIVTEPTSAES